MYIDFHTHAFSDKIVEKAMSSLIATGSAYGLKAHTDGTVRGLKELLVKRNISKAVILPIATKPSQQTIINDWAAQVMQEDDFFCPFGSIHPDADDFEEEIDRIKSLNLHGIKLHPDYQNFMIDDPKLIPVFRKCAKAGLPVLIHSGFDPLSPNLIHCTPQAAARAFEKCPETTMIFAHGGAMNMWDDVEKYLAGKEGNIYFDVSVIAGRISTEQLTKIIRKHGADRILFGSDCPWDDPANEIDMINQTELNQEEKDMIFYKNALKLLNL